MQVASLRKEFDAQKLILQKAESTASVLRVDVQMRTSEVDSLTQTVKLLETSLVNEKMRANKLADEVKQLKGNSWTCK